MRPHNLMLGGVRLRSAFVGAPFELMLVGVEFVCLIVCLFCACVCPSALVC